MSGGVDSAVAAYLLQKEGYEVCGVTLRTWEADGEEESRCCEIDDAKRVSNKLGIKHYALNCVEDFSKKVVDPFVQSYLDGQTPNPCIECNHFVKWEKMLYAAKVMQADYIATGHYAHVIQSENGRYTVKTAKHAAKDQTYMLYKLSQEQLQRTLMPLGDYTKDEVRRIAIDAGLPVAQKPDSQEICFVTDGHYANFIEEYAQKKNNQASAASAININDSAASGTNTGNPAAPAINTDDPAASAMNTSEPTASGKNTPESSGTTDHIWKVPGPGCFVDESGKKLGTHKGITHYTIGQRKGLGIALGHPVFVKKIDPVRNEVVLSEEPALFYDKVLCRDVNFLSIPGMEPGEQLRVRAKVRYHHKAADATLEMREDGCVLIHFDLPVRAPAPGQSSVFYDENDCVVGGGIIVQPEDNGDCKDLERSQKL